SRRLVPPAVVGLVRVNVPVYAPLAVATPLKAVPAGVKVTLLLFTELPIVIVGSVMDAGKKLKVPEAVSDVALVVRVNTLLGVTAELVTVIVGAVMDVGGAETVPIACAVVALVVRVNKFEGDEWVIVRDVEVNGGL